MEKGGVTSFSDSFAIAESSVGRINVFAEKPAHRKAANRRAKFTQTNGK